MTERVQVQPDEIEVGDLVEVEWHAEYYTEDELLTYRGLIIRTEGGIRTSAFAFGKGAPGYTFYRLPKPAPEEPKGLGAVVEDGDGDLWIRRTDGKWYYGEAASGLSWTSLVHDFDGSLTVKSNGYTA